MVSPKWLPGRRETLNAPPRQYTAILLEVKREQFNFPATFAHPHEPDTVYHSVWAKLGALTDPVN